MTGAGKRHKGEQRAALNDIQAAIRGDCVGSRSAPSTEMMSMAAVRGTASVTTSNRTALRCFGGCDEAKSRRSRSGCRTADELSCLTSAARAARVLACLVVRCGHLEDSPPGRTTPVSLSLSLSTLTPNYSSRSATTRTTRYTTLFTPSPIHNTTSTPRHTDPCGINVFGSALRADTSSIHPGTTLE